MKKRNILKTGGIFTLFWIVFSSVKAQFSIDGQLVQRGEYRHGFGKIMEKNEKPAAFIAQRARIQMNYIVDRFTFYTSIQDVRTWGNTAQLNATDPFLSLHEAWVELNIKKNASLKIGRQELNYDNFRFLGNVDWALQARSHDMALFKYKNKNSKLHIGATFNQDDQKLHGNQFINTSQYKTAQFAWIERTWNERWIISALAWNEGREKNGIQYFRQTWGIPTLKFSSQNSTLSAYYYHQSGRTVGNKKMNAFNASLQFKQQFQWTSKKLIKRKLHAVIGSELISGTPSADRTVHRAFSPWYGTNHLFNGYMDLFFVGGSFENNVGLWNSFIKTRMEFSEIFFIQIDGHYFRSQAKAQTSSGNSYATLGTEWDASVGWIIHQAISIQAGYSHFFPNTALAQLTNVVEKAKIQNWTYLMLIVRPNMKQKFIGILL